MKSKEWNTLAHRPYGRASHDKTVVSKRKENKPRMGPKKEGKGKKAQSVSLAEISSRR